MEMFQPMVLDKLVNIKNVYVYSEKKNIRFSYLCEQ